MASGGLLSFSGDFNGESHSLLEIAFGILIDGLHVLDIDVGDNDIVFREQQLVLDLVVLIDAKHRLSNNPRGVFMEDIETLLSHCRSNARGHHIAEVSDRVLHVEDLGPLLLTVLINPEEPVIGEGHLQRGVVGGLDDHFVGSEHRPQLNHDLL